MCPLHVEKEHETDELIMAAMSAIFKLSVHKVRVSCTHTITEMSCRVGGFCVQSQAILGVHTVVQYGFGTQEHQDMM